MHAAVQDELRRIEAMEQQLKEKKQALVRNANQQIPLPSGVCLVWERDLFNERGTHVNKDDNFPHLVWHKTFEKCRNCGLCHISKVEQLFDEEFESDRKEKYVLQDVEHKACPVCKA